MDINQDIRGLVEVWSAPYSPFRLLLLTEVGNMKVWAGDTILGLLSPFVGSILALH